MLSSSDKLKNVVVFTHAAGNSTVGPNARWARFAEGLASRGVRLTVVGSSFFHKYRSVIKSSFLRPIESTLDYASFIHVWAPKYGGYIRRVLNQFIFSLSIFILRKKDFKSMKIDLVVASSPHPFIVLGALYWARKFKAKFVFESRDLWPILLIEHLGMSIFSPYVICAKFMEYIAVKKSSFIITPKELEKNYYLDRYRFKDVFWIPNTSMRKVHLSEQKARSDFTILYAGSLQSIYKIDDIILAVRESNDKRISLVILGDGPEKEILRALVNDDDRIQFRDWVMGEEYFKALSTADICYFSTVNMFINRYGFSSNKISDYLSNGKPVLAHTSNGLDGLVNAGAALQSSPGDIKSLQSNILRLIDHPNELKSMKVAAKKYYLEHYDYDKVTDNLARLI